MHTLTIDLLAVVEGGRTNTTAPDGTTTFQQSNYETCVQAIQDGGREKYPDNRWFFQRWAGVKDENAGARADWVKSSIPAACGPPG